MGYRKLKRIIIIVFVFGLILMSLFLAALIQPNVNNYETIFYKAIGALGVGLIALIFYFLKTLFKKSFMSENKKLKAKNDRLEIEKNSLKVKDEIKSSEIQTVEANHPEIEKEEVKPEIVKEEGIKYGYASEYDY